MDNIIVYLLHGELLKEKAKAQKLRYRIANCIMIRGKLYKRKYLYYLDKDEPKYILHMIHESIYGNIIEGPLAYEVNQQGCHCPILWKDTKKFAQKSDKCSKFSNLLY